MDQRLLRKMARTLAMISLIGGFSLQSFAEETDKEPASVPEDSNNWEQPATSDSDYPDNTYDSSEGQDTYDNSGSDSYDD